MSDSKRGSHSKCRCLNGHETLFANCPEAAQQYYWSASLVSWTDLATIFQNAKTD